MRQLRRPTGVLLQELPDGEAVILHVESGVYLGLDPVGLDIWNTINGADSVETAFQSLLDRYEVEPDRLRNDIKSLAQELIDNGLLEDAQK